MLIRIAVLIFLASASWAGDADFAPPPATAMLALESLLDELKLKKQAALKQLNKQKKRALSNEAGTVAERIARLVLLGKLQTITGKGKKQKILTHQDYGFRKDPKGQDAWLAEQQWMLSQLLIPGILGRVLRGRQLDQLLLDSSTTTKLSAQEKRQHAQMAVALSLLAGAAVTLIDSFDSKIDTSLTEYLWERKQNIIEMVETGKRNQKTYAQLDDLPSDYLSNKFDQHMNSFVTYHKFVISNKAKELKPRVFSMKKLNTIKNGILDEEYL